MAEPNLIYMADILLPTTTITSSYPWLSILFLSLVFLCLGIVSYLLVLYTKPLNTLTRQLKQGKILPREAAHRLAQLIPKQSVLAIKLNHLRFCRQEPQYIDLLNLLYQFKKENKYIKKAFNV